MFHRYFAFVLLLNASTSGAMHRTVAKLANRTALHCAQSAGEVKGLIASGARVNAQDCDGRTPLFTAHARALPALMQLGANPDIKSYRSEGILVRGIESSKNAENKFRELKLKYPKALTTGSLAYTHDEYLICHSPTVLMYSVTRGDIKRIETLLGLIPEYKIFPHLGVLRLLAQAAHYRESWLYHHCDGESPGYSLVFEDIDTIFAEFELRAKLGVTF